MDRPGADNDDGFESLGDATGNEAPNAQEPMNPGHDVSDEAVEEPAGDEKTAIEGAAGLAATHRGFGAAPTNIQGGAGTHVPAEGDEHMANAPDERRDSSDPRGY